MKLINVDDLIAPVKNEMQTCNVILGLTNLMVSRYGYEWTNALYWFNHISAELEEMILFEELPRRVLIVEGGGTITTNRDSGQMKFVYDDGGRAAAGCKGVAGDCVCRSIAIATGLPYQEVYDALARGNADERRTRRSAHSSGKLSARNGINVHRMWFKDYMTSHGWHWTPTMGIGTGCKVHLAESELPMGRLIVRISKHSTAVIDGVIHDTHDPSRHGTRCVYGYWSKAAQCP